MNNSASALVILYNGEKPDKHIVENIIGMLYHHGVAVKPETTVVKHFDEESLSKLIVSRAMNDALDDNTAQLPSEDSIEQACTYIVGRFGEFFVKSKSNDTSAKYVNFMFAVKNAVDEARSAFPCTESDKALINAIVIIGESEIPKTIRAKTGMTTIAISIIKRIYQNG